MRWTVLVACAASTAAIAFAELPAQADEPTAAASSGVEGPAAETPTARAPRAHPSHRAAGAGIDEAVRRLTKGLDLDAAQQARLRQLLESQQRQIRRLWAENPQPEADRVGPTLAILGRTRDQIRAMLNEEQRKNYPAAVPADATAPAKADLEYWLSRSQPKAPPGADAPK